MTRETRTPLPHGPGREARIDYEYVRAGVASRLMLFAPLEGWRHVAVRESRAAIDYAYILRDLADVHFPSADKITLVQDNLNTHKESALYKAFSSAEASRLADHFEWRYTPKHGTWINIAECELIDFARQFLARRTPDQTTLAAEVEAWETTRNGIGMKFSWQFTTQDARIKLSHLCPQIQ